MGWVLEAEGQLVGYLGSIPLLYHFGDKTLIAAATTGLAVEPAYRGFSHVLVASFLGQENVDLFLSTTAMESVGKIMKALKSDALPQKDYDEVLFWVLDPAKFVTAVMRKLAIDGPLGALGRALGSALVKGNIAIRRRGPRGMTTTSDIRETSVDDIDDEFQALWTRKCNVDARLLAERTPAVLRWHFEVLGSRRWTRVLRFDSCRRLIGYAIITTELDTTIGLRRSTVADMFVEHDDPEVMEQLLVAVYEHATNAGSHVLEVLGFPASVRHICLKWKPYSRRYPACPFYYRARNRALHDRLATEDAWYACPFDGDTTLSL